MRSCVRVRMHVCELGRVLVSQQAVCGEGSAVGRGLDRPSPVCWQRLYSGDDQVGVIQPCKCKREDGNVRLCSTIQDSELNILMTKPFHYLWTKKVF